MGIRIYSGSVGAGKSLSAVRDIVLNVSNRTTYSNIRTYGVKNNILIKPEMIIKKEIDRVMKKKSTGEEVTIYKKSLNIDFWKNIKECIDVVIDEAHTVFSSRRSMSKQNILMSEWLALIRRVLGSADGEIGNLILITQMVGKIDLNARDMCNQVRWHRCHFIKTCKRCGRQYKESSDSAEPIEICQVCGCTILPKSNHKIEVWHFKNVDTFERWYFAYAKTYHKHYFITDGHKYMKKYNTLQWDNLFSEGY